MAGGTWMRMPLPNMKDSCVWIVDLTLTNTSKDTPVSVTSVGLEFDREMASSHVFLVDSKVRQQFNNPETSGTEIGQNVYLGPQESIVGRMTFFDPIGSSMRTGATLTIVDLQSILNEFRHIGRDSEPVQPDNLPLPVGVTVP